MSFSHPERLFWLVGWGVLAAFVLTRQRQRLQLLRKLLDWPAIRRLAGEQRRGRETAVLCLRLAALAFWITAWASPEWGSEKVKIERNALDIVFAVDCSRSMQAEDPPPSRRQIAIRELSELMQRFQGNRMGLVGFAGKAFCFCPLTLDTSATQLFLEQLDENAIPVPGTAIGEAIRVSSTVFSRTPGSKILILLTDGEDHHSDPAGAAKEAASQGITIYTVGIGRPEGAPIPDGAGGNIRNGKGEIVISKCDEPMLKEVSSVTGGSFLRIRTTTDSLDSVVKAVLSQERRKMEGEMFLRRQPQFMWFIGAGIVLLLLAQLATARIAYDGKAA